MGLEKCPKCNGATETKKNGPHIELRCFKCGHIKFLPQPIENFTIPIGKYKGRKILEIKKTDPAYLKWASETVIGTLQKRAKEALEYGNS